MEKIFKRIQPPFKYDKMGQMIFDSDGNLVLDVRGWGMFGKLENGHQIQDDFGEYVANALSTITQKDREKDELRDALRGVLKFTQPRHRMAEDERVAVDKAREVLSNTDNIREENKCQHSERE